MHQHYALYALPHSRSISPCQLGFQGVEVGTDDRVSVVNPERKSKKFRRNTKGEREMEMEVEKGVVEAPGGYLELILGLKGLRSFWVQERPVSWSGNGSGKWVVYAVLGVCAMVGWVVGFCAK